MFSDIVANENLQSHGSYSHGMERRCHLFFSFIFGFHLLHEFVKGYISVSCFRFFFLARLLSSWRLECLTTCTNVRYIDYHQTNSGGRPLLLGWMRWYKKTHCLD